MKQRFGARLGLVAAGSIVLAVLIVCAFLEAAFGFCLGCWVYSFLPQKVKGVVSKSLSTL